jgi:hypothetical protein
LGNVGRAVSKKDLVLAISFRRGLRQTIEGARSRRLLRRYF